MDGTPVANAVVTMSYLTGSITTTTLFLPQFENDGALYMFDARPCRELGARLGTSVTLSVQLPGLPPQAQEVRLLPNYGVDEQLVDFYYGEPPRIFPPPAPPAPLPTTPITGMASRHLLAMGSVHSCAIVDEGLRCWGWNSYGQAGNGVSLTLTTSVISRPVTAMGLASGVRSVATGYRHTCVVLVTGRVKCWGHSWVGVYGAAGPLAPNVTSVPHDVPGIETAIDIVAGAFNSCVLLQDQRVMCWGNNDNGQLGNGVIGASWNPTPTLVLNGAGQPLAGVTEIAANGWHVCAVVAGGVKCWGEMHGFNGLTRVGAPVDVIAPGSGIKTVGVGYHASCAADDKGATLCWGNMLYPNDANNTSPRPVPGLAPDVVKLALNRYFTCALRANGEVFCWGLGFTYNQVAGQFGLNATLPVTQPVRIEGLTNVVDIAAGEEHVCVRLADAKLKCWGSNSGGQLGNGVTPAYPYPWHSPTTVTAYNGEANAVAAGGFHSCAITIGGGVACWGANGYGQLGGGFMSVVSPQAVTVSGLPTTVIAVSAGRQHTCALTTAREVYCWGRNDLGQLGNATEVHSSVPVRVAGLSGVQAIAAGEYQTCALLTDGGVRCWGQNWTGQLGNGQSGNYYATPVAVIGLAGRAVALAAGDDHMCAVTEGGAAQCWGYNVWGQLGNNSTLASSTPVTVTGLTSGVTAMTAGRSYTCAVVNGGAMCWGDGSAGQLGDGVDLSGGSRPYTSPVPVNVVGLPGPAIDISSGGATSCARLNNGETYCWGADWGGQLGQGVANSQSTPIRLPLPTGSVRQLSIENEHMCARLQDSTLRCWGVNVYGQVGNGVSLVSPTPVDVLDIERAQWTYMLYLAGDNDLSSYLNNIAQALEKLPRSAALNIVLFFDGQGTDDNYIWSTRDGALQKYRLDERDSRTGDPATLTGFIEWARANFPAQHYYLSIANHGRASSGIAWDTQNGAISSAPDGLDPVELRAALAAATRQGAWKLDVIHFDACLMGLLEMAYQVKEYANFMIASQNLTAAFYPYDEYARTVIDNPAIAPVDLAQQIAGIYFDHDYLKLNTQPRTISVLNLGKIGDITAALNVLATTGLGRMGSVAQTVKEIRSEVQVFDASPDFTKSPPLYYTLTAEDEYVDLRHLAGLLRDKSGDADVRNAAAVLFDALAPGDGNFVVQSQRQSGFDRLVSGQEWKLDNSNGVSLFFPLAPGVYGYDQYMGGHLFTLTGDVQWDEFLQQYYTATAVAPVPPLDPGIPPVLTPYNPTTQHCAEMAGCLWGAVYVDGAPVKDAVVTLNDVSGARSSDTAFVANNEAHPIYRLDLDGLALKVGDPLVLTIVYSGAQEQRTVIYNPIDAAGKHEQNMDFVVRDPQSPPPEATTEVAIVQVMVSPSVVKPGHRAVLFDAKAMANDGSTIVEYRWRSDRIEGSLGNASSILIPVEQLPVGMHKVTVTAVNEQGVESAPVTLDLVVEARWLYLPVVQR